MRRGHELIQKGDGQGKSKETVGAARNVGLKAKTESGQVQRNFRVMRKKKERETPSNSPRTPWHGREVGRRAKIRKKKKEKRRKGKKGLKKKDTEKSVEKRNKT